MVRQEAPVFNREGIQADFFDRGGFSHLEGVYEALPYSDFKRWIPENSIYLEAFAAFPLGRLSGVKQLSFLSYTGPNPENVYNIPTNHDRLDHSIVVALMTEQILKRNGFSHEEIVLGIIAALLHDIATPAHGDATQAIDPKNLDEENNWKKMLDKKGREYLKGNGITVKQIDDIIHNKGIIGKVLDIADRITYTMKDCHGLIGQSDSSDIDPHPYLLRPRYILSHNPKIGNIYQEVGADKKTGEVFFTNPENLSTFLMLRAILFKDCYMHPSNQARDMFVANLIKELYSSEDKTAVLTPDKLRKMRDDNLVKIVEEHYGYSPYRMYTRLVNWHPQYYEFSSLEEAEKKSEDMSHQEGIHVIGVKECKGFNSGKKYKVSNRFGQIVPFEEEQGPTYGRLGEIETSVKRAYLFYTTTDEDSPIKEFIQQLN